MIPAAAAQPPIVGRSLRHFMTRAGKTAANLADLMGVSTRAVQRWRGRENMPPAPQLHQLAVLLRLDAADFGALVWWWGSR